MRYIWIDMDRYGYLKKKKMDIDLDKPRITAIIMPGLNTDDIHVTRYIL